MPHYPPPFPDVEGLVSHCDMYAEREWLTCDERPTQPMWTSVRSSPEFSAVPRRVLFTGSVWLTNENVEYWRPAPEADDMVGALVETPMGVSAIEGLEVLELGSLPPGDERLALAELARMELDVEVVRLYQPGLGTKGVTSGRVLATSEKFAAQSIGEDGVLIVEQQRMNRRLQPGENVSLDMQPGEDGGGPRITAYQGMLFDVNVRAPFLSRDQASLLRHLMIDALSQVRDAPKQDHLIKEALRYAIRETVKIYQIDKTVAASARVTLSVKDAARDAQINAQALADEANESAKADELNELDHKAAQPRLSPR